MTRRRQRHHVVPRLHLRGFATSHNRLTQLDLATGERIDVSVTDAAVIRNFYTVVLPDGTRTDAWERWLGDVEDEFAPALKRAVEMTEFGLSDSDREHLARWVALQYLRGPSNRRQMAEIASFTLRAQVGMGGLAYLRHAMSRGLGRDVPLAEAEAVWDDVTSAEGPRVVVAGDEHLRVLTGLYDQATAEVYGRSWCRIRFARRTLVVSDSPITVVPDEDDFSGGLVGARVLAVPLDRHTMLWLKRPGTTGPVADREMEPSAVLAHAHNTFAVVGAERFVYHHPDDQPVPADVEIPRAQLPRIQVTGGSEFANRDRPLEDVLDQIATHTGYGGASLIADYTWPIPGYDPVLP